MENTRVSRSPPSGRAEPAAGVRVPRPRAPRRSLRSGERTRAHAPACGLPGPPCAAAQKPRDLCGTDRGTSLSCSGRGRWSAGVSAGAAGGPAVTEASEGFLTTSLERRDPSIHVAGSGLSRCLTCGLTRGGRRKPSSPRAGGGGGARRPRTTVCRDSGGRPGSGQNRPPLPWWPESHHHHSRRRPVPC